MCSLYTLFFILQLDQLIYNSCIYFFQSKCNFKILVGTKRLFGSFGFIRSHFIDAGQGNWTHSREWLIQGELSHQVLPNGLQSFLRRKSNYEKLRNDGCHMMGEAHWSLWCFIKWSLYHSGITIIILSDKMSSLCMFFSQF